jgi:hypothetical protein
VVVDASELLEEDSLKDSIGCSPRNNIAIGNEEYPILLDI